MKIVHINSRPLRRFLLKYYDADGDGRLSESDLKTVKLLEITTPRMQLWDESPEISLVTRTFSHPEDLKKLSNLGCLVISSQPISKLLLPQKSLQEVSVIHCPLRGITVRDEIVSKKRGDGQIDWRSPACPEPTT